MENQVHQNSTSWPLWASFKFVEKLRRFGVKYSKHRTYVDNVSFIFPILKEFYDGKYIELDFSQNLSSRPKDEVQSAHFSGK